MTMTMMMMMMMMIMIMIETVLSLVYLLSPTMLFAGLTFTPIRFNFKEYMKRTGVNVRLEVIQKTALLGTAKILRKVLSM